MAKRTVHMLIDDLDGGDADETISFGVDGVLYEIDLSKKNATKLRNTLARYIEAYRVYPQPRSDDLTRHAAGIAGGRQPCGAAGRVGADRRADGGAGVAPALVPAGRRVAASDRPLRRIGACLRSRRMRHGTLPAVASAGVA